MSDLDFSFQDSPWELYLNTKRPGETVSAAHFLTLLEEETESAVEDAFAALEERGLSLDISGLPVREFSGQAALRLKQELEWSEKGLDPDLIPPNDPLRLYLEEVAAFRQEDEAALAEMAAQGDETAEEKRMTLAMARVTEIAREYAGCGVLLMDLIQEGGLALWQNIAREKEAREAAVRNAMARAVTLQARERGVGQKMRQALEDYRAVDERLLGELGRNPTLEEIAQELHMTPEDAETVRRCLEDARMLDRATNVPQDPPEEENQAVEDTAYFQMRSRITEMLSVLPPEDAKLLTLRFGLEKGLPLSPEEAGRQLGIAVDEVLSREAKALALLRREENGENAGK